MAQQAQTLSETDAREFERKLREFHASLPDQEKVLLAAMVVHAAGRDEELAADSGGREAGPGGGQAPSENAAKALAEKLDRFHDSLPEGQHQLVDALVAKAAGKQTDDVQGYWWWWTRWYDPASSSAPAWEDYYFNYCRTYGGTPFWLGFEVDEWGRFWSGIGCWV